MIKTLNKGDILILDNMSSHKVTGIKELVQSVGATIKYLPPYSPECSKIKTELRKAEKINTEDFIEATGKALNHITITLMR